ncbi:hypothetical protein NPA13_02385 [Mycoplasma sp. 2045]|uniref:integrase catalytic domain-containing protein n=1 Tax=Mycoplasma sp. 2045 TaxID=2967301 RepID=UPI00211C1CF4|nr:DDE-type integrase/transposase/recombinase [Mycoplasma sp. 2045]UUM20285.1 hypothetical protein NPA13_02385 [Mycoplasma sp. 2045]
MNRLNLFCLIRKRKRTENKKYKCKIYWFSKSRLQRSKNQIIATDVTYIQAPKDCENNFVFLSVAIDHKSKYIVNYNLSTRNDLELVIQHMSKIKLNQKWIAHSDHGFQYSSKIM